MPNGGTDSSSLPPHSNHPQGIGDDIDDVIDDVIGDVVGVNNGSSLQGLDLINAQEDKSAWDTKKHIPSSLTECDNSIESEGINGTCRQNNFPQTDEGIIEKQSHSSYVDGKLDQSDYLSEKDSLSATSVTDKDSNNMSKSYLSPGYIIGAVFLVLFFAHPKWINLLASSADVAAEMSYTQNFYLWTRYNPDEPDKIIVGLPKKLEETHFSSRCTFVIIHGFLGSGKDDWIIKMKNAFLKREDCNVITVDWAAGTTTVGYYVIQARVMDVGADVGKLLHFLADEAFVSPAMVHVIGHSLGAHIAGFAGKALNGTLARITGLDPAGLMYHNSAADKRLDKSDAHFVDVIHTHGCTTALAQWTDCFGIDENLGDADFWPNGGQGQPACVEESGGDGGKLIKEGASCDHGMAYVYYTESLQYGRSTTDFLARPCATYVFYNSCECGDVPQYMGYNANPSAPGVFYLDTANRKPYALQDADCPSGAFSTVQLIGLFILVGVSVAAILIVILVVVERQFNIVVCSSLRSVVHWATRRPYSDMGSSNLINNDQGEVFT